MIVSHKPIVSIGLFSHYTQQAAYAPSQGQQPPPFQGGGEVYPNVGFPQQQPCGGYPLQQAPYGSSYPQQQQPTQMVIITELRKRHHSSTPLVLMVVVVYGCTVAAWPVGCVANSLESFSKIHIGDCTLLTF